MNLTPRQRFLTAFEHREGDRVPIFDVPNNPALYRREFGKENYFLEGVPAVILAKKLGLDACMIPEGGYTALISKRRNWLDNSRFKDELGVEYRCSESSWPLAVPVSPSIKSRQDWEKIVLPDPREDWRIEQIRLAVKEAHRGEKDDIALIAGIRSAFAVMYISMGLEALSMALYEDPELVMEMSDRLCCFWTESAIRCSELGVDAVYIANDMGLNNSTIISPDSLRKFFLSQFKKQVQEIKETGVKVILHSCGNINAIMDDIVFSGVDAYNNIQVIAGMNIAEIKRKYGNKLTLIGNVDCTNIMTSPDPNIIEKAVMDTIRIASPGGGHILATDHSFHQGIPLENVDAFIRAGRRWGKYPIEIPDKV
ncbi:MAG: hypothetical protein DRP87_09790 [Spirochaetes bacterium]|nr:MAG: hypothetical protein DRP87_09790 [Spirochaetota bacterium]